MGLQLTADECRVLGVLVEKAMTTPAQYPLSLNGVVVGCNQKNNRDPVTNLDEERCLAALDGLRSKQLVREVSMTGARVEKYRHVAREVLGVTTTELVLLVELMLRGPQTPGELRGRASRMHPLESIEVVEAALDGLATRETPLVVRVGPAPGGRTDRYAQLLCPDLHRIDRSVTPTMSRTAPPSHSPGPASVASAAMSGGSAGHAEDEGLAERLDRLERRVDELTRLLESLAASSGQSLPPGQ